MDPVKFVEQFLKNLTWSILEYFVPNEYSLWEVSSSFYV